MDQSELILMSLAVVIVLGFLCCVAVLMVRKIQARTNPEKIYSNKLMYNTLSYACIILAGVSWVTNIGWIRLIFFPVTVVHAVIFFFVNYFYCSYAKAFSKIRWVNFGVYATYLLINILMPDGGDTPDSIRVVFGLLDARNWSGLFTFLAAMFFLVHLVLVIIQVIYTVRERRKDKE